MNTTPQHPPRGFTLIELMITVAIVGILAAVALPSYRDYMRRGEIPEAFTYLSNYRVTMEQYYQDNRNYGSNAICAGTATSAIQVNPSGTRYFNFGCTLTNSGQGFTLTAQGYGTRTSGYDYSINESNVRATTKFKNVTQTGKACWLVNGSEC